VFRVVFENFYLNKGLFYLINYNRHPLLDAFFSKFYLFGKGWVLIPIFIGLFIFQNSSLKVFLYTMGISTIPGGGFKETHQTTKTRNPFKRMFIFWSLCI